MAAIATTTELCPAKASSQSTWRQRLARPVAILCGLVLLSAAGLKLYGINVSPYGQYGWLLTPAVQSTAVVWEVLLGIWLFSGASRLLAWLATVATFAAFAVVSGYLGYIGQASCGCFGVIQATPWAAFAIDMAALILLAFARPSGLMSERLVLEFSGSVQLATMLGVAILVITAGALARHGSFSRAFAALTDEPVHVSPPFIDFGELAPGQSAKRLVTISNHSVVAIHIYGGTSDCSCIVTESLPLVILPGESAEITIRFSAPHLVQGQITRTAELQTDLNGARSVRLMVGCVIN